MVELEGFLPGGGGDFSLPEDVDLPDNPNDRIGFEIDPKDEFFTFRPEFYPSKFRQVKEKELNREGSGCNGEQVSVKKIKNREFHVAGLILEGEVGPFNSLIDHEGVVEIFSPLVPSGGMECYIKHGEIGNQKGWDPMTKQRQFKYSLDLVSTGDDEYGRGRNVIVTDITGDDTGGQDIFDQATETLDDLF